VNVWWRQGILNGEKLDRAAKALGGGLQWRKVFSRIVAEDDRLDAIVCQRVPEPQTMQRLLDADAAADMLARENSGFSVDTSVRITLLRPHRRV